MTTTTEHNIATMTKKEAYDILVGNFYLAKKNPGSSTPEDGIKCRYTEADGSPSCLIGHFMELVGLERPEFGTDDNTSKTARQLLDQTSMPYGTVDLLYKAQQEADSGRTWRDAIDTAASSVGSLS